MDLLYDLGHERIGIITGPLVSPLSRDRLRGATTRAKRRSAERDFVVMTGDFSVESGADAAQRLLATPSSADGDLLLQRRDGDGRARLRAKRGGIRVPRDLSVVGFDDIRFARYTEPPLTTVAQPMRRSAKARCGCCWRSSATTQARPDSVTLPHTLITRTSTAAPHARRQ